MKTFQQNLKEQRHNNDMNRAEFAELVGVADGTVGMWESGANLPSLNTVIKIAKQSDLPQWVRSLFIGLLADLNVGLVAVADDAAAEGEAAE